MPKICARIKWHRRKKYDHRFFKFVGHPYRDIKRWIIAGALGSLHPVNDAASVSGRLPCLAHGNPFIKKDLVDRIHR